MYYSRLNLHSLVLKAAAAFHNNDRLMKLVLEINRGEPQPRSENVLYIFLFRYIFMDKGHDLRYPRGLENTG